MCSYVDLPIDIHLLVLRYLPPKAIASTRLTCRVMEEVTKTRAVWLFALKRTCLSYGVPFITYDFECMSREELEYAATGPDRFLHSGRRAMDSPSRTLHPVGERCRLPLSIQDPLIMRSTDDIVILPGGRFVLAYKGTLLVWDLATVSESPFVVLDSNDEVSPGFRFCGVDLQSLVHYPAVSKVHLAVSAIKNNQDGFVPASACVACELNLAESPPSFSVVGILHNASFECSAGLGSRIVFLTRKPPGFFGLWDSEQNTAASWVWESGRPINDPLLVTERHIIAHDQQNNTIVVYDLPPSDLAEGRIPAPSQTHVVQTISLPPAKDPLRFKVPSYNSSKNSDIIVIEADFIPANGDHPSGQQRFTYGQRSFVIRCIASLRPGDKPITMPETPVIYDHVLDRLPPKQSDDSVVSVYRRGYPCGEELWAHFSSLEGHAQAQAVCIGPREGSFFKIPESRTWGMHADYDLCPVTGRICVHRWDFDAIVVHDTMPSYVPAEHE
ncbi:uncharacterized protein SCHCODRAFT_02294827 [Schizophyllum commune H4-8]|uniref:uncharacterized protein n=1 Tax=Schizophyllum commune (strain H4-8 / FGSC 9210) TaxID=578458 RepID=UPI00215FD1C9|nr:uncharacterized protein SCHCODRAFT_02294827 [Schizophyllum commune H4-8]KAI5892572.1 hypothetical protein SCHCODRAFT_02294827 [Schizophyllum commune H4-8]